MTSTQILTSGNARFLETDARTRVPSIPFIPNQQLYVVACIDPRVDPLAIFDLQLGDAIVARTVGGRVTDGVLDDLAWISYLHETKTPNAGWFDIAVVHHTDCGSALMADDELRAGFVARGFDDAIVRATAVTDPSTTVSVDVRRIVDLPTACGDIRVSGWSYDVATGVAEQVVAPTSRNA